MLVYYYTTCSNEMHVVIKNTYICTQFSVNCRSALSMWRAYVRAGAASFGRLRRADRDCADGGCVVRGARVDGDAARTGRPHTHGGSRLVRTAQPRPGDHPILGDACNGVASAYGVHHHLHGDSYRRVSSTFTPLLPVIIFFFSIVKKTSSN